jgi:hypothetical protein
MRTSRRCLTLAALAALTTLAFASPAMATHTINWKGQTWRISPETASAAIDGDGAVVLTRTNTALDATLSVAKLQPLNGTDSFVNANGTPWVQYTYEDNAAFRGVDLFVDSNVPVLGARLQAGSLFNCQGLGYVRHGFGPLLVEEVVFAEPDGCDPAGPPSRTAGEVHTIYAGERSDGTVDYNYDGQWFSSTLLRDATGPFAYNNVLLRLRANQGTSARFLDFQAGDNHPGPAPTAGSQCAKNGWQAFVLPTFKNRGDCTSYAATGGKH